MVNTRVGVDRGLVQALTLTWRVAENDRAKQKYEVESGETQKGNI